MIGCQGCEELCKVIDALGMDKTAKGHKICDLKGRVDELLHVQADKDKYIRDLQDQLATAVAAERKRCRKEFVPLIVAVETSIQGLRAHTDPMLNHMEQSAVIERLQEALAAVQKIQRELP